MNIDDWFDELATKLPATDVYIIKQSYAVANKAHARQKRKSGAPYITHCVAVAKTLANLNLEGEVIAAGLLHDVPEDTTVTLLELSQEFGPTIANLVDSVTKLKHAADELQIDQLTFLKRKEAQRAENLRKMILGMGDDVRAVLIKLADRLHNMRTLKYMPPEKQKRIAQETLEIFAPLANRLGIYRIKLELEDLAFKYLYTDKHDEIVAKINERNDEIDKYINKVAQQLTQFLNEENISHKLSWRANHIYSIYKKMKRKEVDIDQVYDIRALRVIVPHIQDCYAVLGVVHTKWHPISGEFDDYIAVPKDNGYQSLHTAVRDNQGKLFEVQIRTSEMHNQAEYGIAAHWRYKDGTQADNKFDHRIAMMRQALKFKRDIHDITESVADAHEFMDAVKNDVIREKVYIFTPKGDVEELPIGATPIDFAYKIHTQVGHKCRGAKVNGHLVPLDYQLKNSDKVEILTTKRGGPSRDWLNENLGYVKTSRARKKIRLWFKKQNYIESVAQGRVILEKELKRLHITAVRLDEIATTCGYKKIDDFLAAIGYNDISIQHVIRKIEELTATSLSDEEIIEQIQAKSKHAMDSDSGIDVMGIGDLLTKMAQCCHPLPGDLIIGYVTKGRGVTIHRTDCVNILSLQDKERLIKVNWGAEKNTNYVTEVIVKVYDRKGLARDITNVVANENVNIRNIKINARDKYNRATIRLEIEISNLSALRKLMDKIEHLPNITEVVRKW